MHPGVMETSTPQEVQALDLKRESDLLSDLVRCLLTHLSSRLRVMKSEQRRSTVQKLLVHVLLLQRESMELSGVSVSQLMEHLREQLHDKNSTESNKKRQTRLRRNRQRRWLHQHTSHANTNKRHMTSAATPHQQQKQHCRTIAMAARKNQPR